jgi:hypothetical protein
MPPRGIRKAARQWTAATNQNDERSDDRGRQWSNSRLPLFAHRRRAAVRESRLSRTRCRRDANNQVARSSLRPPSRSPPLPEIETLKSAPPLRVARDRWSSKDAAKRDERGQPDQMQQDPKVFRSLSV